jgi:uncharacterized protein YjiK
MKSFIIGLLLLITTGVVLGAYFSGKTPPASKEKKEAKINKGNSASSSTDIVIRHKWELPPVLLEVSGIAWLDQHQFACVQDEAGTIFIYNTKTASIEREIVFTGPGDFEGITLNGNTAYVVRSDGALFEVDMKTKKTNQYKTGLTASNNVETVFFDKANNRLLLMGKEPDEVKEFKNIYAFSLSSHSMNNSPVLRIDLSDPALITDAAASKKKKYIMPSGIALHPASKDIYVLDGPKSRLIVMASDATVKKVYDLGKEFYKPEGISFSPTGDLYISNEGKKIPANIIQLELAK